MKQLKKLIHNRASGPRLRLYRSVWFVESAIAEPARKRMFSARGSIAFKRVTILPSGRCVMFNYWRAK